MSTADVTERDPDPLTVPEVARIVTWLPLLFATPVATPAAFTVTRPFVAEVHVTLAVISLELPSEKLPVAVKGCVCPIATDAVEGVTVIDCSAAAVVVPLAVPLIDPIVAVIIAEPDEVPVTRPVELTD